MTARALQIQQSLGPRKEVVLALAEDLVEEYNGILRERFHKLWMLEQDVVSNFGRVTMNVRHESSSFITQAEIEQLDINYKFSDAYVWAMMCNDSYSFISARNAFDKRYRKMILQAVCLRDATGKLPLGLPEINVIWEGAVRLDS
eukprot:CAMPEP_0119316422 /NCGR_PEP_ID=MMETSP1333-20130426/39574_1 /TAXON_ID=418940 /ORGANISM="Scyphosphaera apsteinii, Strain RCC1455" /LENGTH=144 /DNA_ID=CAMNT_0007322063 /DNA_START=209 /DNA_END=643 /DNA_ORIENTATION=+